MSTLLLVRGHGALPFVGPRRALHELAPAVRRAHADALRHDEAAVDAARLLVARALVGAEVDAHALGLVARQVVPRQLHDVLAVDHRSHQVGELRVPPVGPLERGREPQPEGRQVAARRERIALAGQVVHLVVDHQPEARPQVRHVQVRRVVGGDGQRQHAVIASAHHAHLASE
jgi:hypothetical protein